MLLDGHRTLHQAWETIWKNHPDSAPSQVEVVRVLAHLNRLGLLVSEKGRDPYQIFSQFKEERGRELKNRFLHFFFIRIPLWDPDSLLKSINSISKGIFSWAGFAVWILVMVWGGIAALNQSRDLFAQAQGIIAPSNLPLLYLVWAGIKFLHEMGHACAARRWGCEVHQMGVMLLVLTPIPYVDVTSSYALRSKWKRFAIDAAGMYVELFIAAIAALIWANTGQGLVNQMAYNIIFLASVSTLLFNLNPLLRFDGYYMLSDALEYPNLHQRSFQQIKYLAERFLFGVKQSIPVARSTAEGIGLVGFNLSSTAYRIFVLVVIIGFVAGQFFEIGLILAAFGLLVWGLLPLVKFCRYVLSSPDLARNRLRAQWVTFGGLAGLLLVLALVPLPTFYRTPGVLESIGRSEVIAKSDGFLLGPPADNRNIVSKDQLLLKLVQPDYHVDEIRQEARLREIEQRQRIAFSEEPAYLTALQSQADSIQLQLDAIIDRKQNLDVRAPRSGRWVYTPDSLHPGSWIKRGTGLGEIIDPDRFRFTAIVSQNEAAVFFQEPVKRTSVRLRGEAGISMNATDIRILSVEQTFLPTAALGWLAGGALEVDFQDTSGTKTVEPFYLVYIELERNPQTDPLFFDLRRGVARFQLEPRPLLQQAWVRIRNLLQRRYQL